MALHGLQAACCVFLVYLCFALYVSAKDFSPIDDDEFEQKYEPEPWGKPNELETQDGYYSDETDLAKDNDEKRGTKNDRLRGLRRLSRLYGELGLDNLRPVKKTPEVADDLYHLEDKRDAGPHAWYGTGIYGKRDDTSRGRWRTRSARPQPFRVGLFGKRAYDTVNIEDVAHFLQALRDEESRR